MQQLKNLCLIPSPSGYEDGIIEYLTGQTNIVHEVDNIGNLLIGGGKKILISAHIDELGLIVSNITDDGFIHFLRNSGEDRKCLQGHKFEILTKRGPILAVCMKKAIHVETDSEYESVDKVENMVLSVGASNRDEVLGLGINIGDLVVYKRDFLELGEHKICAQGLDDKAGAWVVLEVMKKNPNASYAFCCQEETGLVGAETMMSHYKTEVSIDLDVCHSTESSLGINQNLYGPIRLGDGVVIEYGSSCNRKLSDELVEVAKKNGIPYQIKAGRGGGTNTDMFLRGGAKTCLLSIPCQNMHTPVEIIDMRDLISARNLLLAWLG